MMPFHLHLHHPNIGPGQVKRDDHVAHEGLLDFQRALEASSGLLRILVVLPHPRKYTGV
jgi:hypothetical protein